VVNTENAKTFAQMINHFNQNQKMLIMKEQKEMLTMKEQKEMLTMKEQKQILTANAYYHSNTHRRADNQRNTINALQLVIQETMRYHGVQLKSIRMVSL